MEVLGRQSCKREHELGWESFHPSSTHQLFDGMPSQPEMSKKNQSISEPVPINSTMKKEEKWLDEALDRILEKFEQMEAKRRCDEKIDRILKKLDEIEANRNKFFEEMGASIKATTVCCIISTTHGTVSSSAYQVFDGMPQQQHHLGGRELSHIGEALAPTAAWELGDRKDMDQTPYIVTKDLLKVTPTKCSMICSSSDTKPDLTVVAPVTCTTLAVINGVATDGTTGNTNIDTPICFKETHAKCSTVGLDVNGSNDQAVVAFQTKTCVLRGDQALDVSGEVFMPSSSMLTPISGCSIVPLISLAITNILLDINSETADWQGPPTSNELVDTICELWSEQWPTFNFYWARLHWMPPWPPPTQGTHPMPWQNLKIKLSSTQIVQSDSTQVAILNEFGDYKKKSNVVSPFHFKMIQVIIPVDDERLLIVSKNFRHPGIPVAVVSHASIQAQASTASSIYVQQQQRIGGIEQNRTQNGGGHGGSATVATWFGLEPCQSPSSSLLLLDVGLRRWLAAARGRPWVRCGRGGEAAVSTTGSDRREAASVVWSSASSRWRQEGGRGHGVARLRTSLAMVDSFRLWGALLVRYWQWRLEDDNGDGAFVVLVSNGSHEVPHDLLANRW
uniref:Uncharacterized protein n=1 Tax=Oryza meridionalis TaxID=40149 RepID=A0A0E0EHM9_9ORYZ